MTSASRGLIRSMLITGSAQVVNIAITILRQKMLAVLLGPSGIGLLSIYNNLQSMVSQAAGLGMGSSGVRELAATRDDYETLGRVRRVLLAAHLVQGLIALVSVWLLRAQIAEWLFHDRSYANEVGLVGIAILVTLISTAQTTLLRGLRRIADLGRVTVLGALGGTVVGLAAVWAFGEAGLIWFVLAQPVCNLLAARWFTRRLPRAEGKPPRLREIPAIWLPMARLGFAFMVGGLMTGATLLFIRGHISTTLGLDAAGLFAASWGISMTYVGFLLTAMAADYYPRLTEVIKDRQAATALMNDQTQLGLAIGGPVLLLLTGWAPWVIALLYSSDFAPAAEILQWQSVGNIFKLASWPLGFSMAASARGKTFFFVQVNFNAVFVLLLLATLPLFGLIATGPAFALAYLAHFAVLFVLVRRTVGFRPDKLTVRLLALHIVLICGLLCVAIFLPTAAFIAAPLLAIATGIFGLRLVLSKIGPHGKVPERLTTIFAKLGWPIRMDP